MRDEVRHRRAYLTNLDPNAQPSISAYERLLDDWIEVLDNLDESRQLNQEETNRLAEEAELTRQFQEASVRTFARRRNQEERASSSPQREESSRGRRSAGGSRGRGGGRGRSTPVSVSSGGQEGDTQQAFIRMADDFSQFVRTGLSDASLSDELTELPRRIDAQFEAQAVRFEAIEQSISHTRAKFGVHLPWKT